MRLLTSSYRSLRAGVFIGLLGVLAGLPLVASAAQYGGGSGTAEDPFLINTAPEFATIGDNPADWGKYFRLINNIDLTGYDEKNLRMIGRWVALGSSENQPFRGSFDGGGRTISGFRYKDTHQDYVGLFQHVTGDVKNVKLVRPIVIGSGLGTGALVGFLEKGGVTHCSATGADVSGTYCVGVLVGSAEGSVLTCGAEGKVAGVMYVGGLIGQVGGGTITRSYSRVEVVGKESVGGLIGAMHKETGIVDSCYAVGPVNGSVYTAGLVGQVVAGRVFRCYSTGRVSGQQSSGGLVGYQRALAQVMGSLWDTQASAQATSIGGTGRTTAEMKSIDTYLSMNWDFSTTWAICEGGNYPVLIWQIPVGDLRCPDGVNFTDFVWFANNWRHDDCRELNYFCDGADLDGSGDVEFRDLTLFAVNWLAGIDR